MFSGQSQWSRCYGGTREVGRRRAGGSFPRSPPTVTAQRCPPAADPPAACDNRGARPLSVWSSQRGLTTFSHGRCDRRRPPFTEGPVAGFPAVGVPVDHGVTGTRTHATRCRAGLRPVTQGQSQRMAPGLGGPPLRRGRHRVRHGPRSKKPPLHGCWPGGVAVRRDVPPKVSLPESSVGGSRGSRSFCRGRWCPTRG